MSESIKCYLPLDNSMIQVKLGYGYVKYSDHKERTEQLELENASLKRQLDETHTVLNAWYNTFGTHQLSHAIARLESAESKLERLNASAYEGRLADAEAKLAEFERQVKDGELVPVDVVYGLCTKHGVGLNFLSIVEYVKRQFAASKYKEQM